MHNQNLKVKCGRCLQQNSVAVMRYAKDGKTLVCQKCSLVATSQLKVPPGVRKHYRCTSCGYKFRRGNAPSLCPYCGRQRVVEDEQITASKMLEWE